ncbi:MAG: hypothetical protein EBS30_12155 [Planctomycetes bacterium]|nr:hypothetical protein [Planctomycetota bacterium]
MTHTPLADDARNCFPGLNYKTMISPTFTQACTTSTYQFRCALKCVDARPVPIPKTLIRMCAIHEGRQGQ